MGAGKQINEVLPEDKIEYQTSENLVNSFIEDWNDRNPKHKLDPDMIDFLKNYLRIGYVAGWDDHRMIVERLINSGTSNNINRYFFMKFLNDLEERV